MSSHREADFEAQFTKSCKDRERRIMALVAEGGLDRAPDSVAETVRIEAHSLAGEAALLRLGVVQRCSAVLEGLLERPETRSGEALAQAVRWWQLLCQEAGSCTGGAKRSIEALERLTEALEAAAAGQPFWLAPPDEGPEAASGHEAEDDAASKPRVLILDDSEISREAMAGILEEEGYPVETAGDLMEFEEKLLAQRPNVILSDINMPDIQGDEICRTLKQRYETEGIPILLISGLPDEELESRSRRAGADGWVSKQSGPDQLVELLDEILSQIIF